MPPGTPLYDHCHQPGRGDARRAGAPASAVWRSDEIACRANEGRRFPGRSAIAGKDVRGRPHLPGEVLTGFCFGSLAHLFLRLADGAAKPLDRLVGLSRHSLHSVSLSTKLFQELG